MKHRSNTFSAAIILLALIVCARITFCQIPNNQLLPSQLKAASSYALSPSEIEFIENKGQLADQNGKPMPEVLYSSDSKEMKCCLTSKGMHFVFSQTIESPDISKKINSPTNRFNHRTDHTNDTVILQRLDMEFGGANPYPRIEAQDITEAFYNYYLAHCKLHGVRSYRKIIYHDLYAHIDFVVYSRDAEMKYDFIVHPGGDPNNISMRYSGMDSMKYSINGKFLIYCPLGKIEEEQPYTYQGLTEHLKITSKFVIADNDLKFQIGKYNRSIDLIIDPPTRQWSTYYGGSKLDYLYNVALDSSNNILISGYTNSQNNIATAGSYKSSFTNGAPAFIAKLNQLGNVIWATYYGGRGNTNPYGLGVDKHNNIIIGGKTTSDNGIATSGAHKEFNSLLNGHGDDGDAFLAKFDSSGALLWGTYYGGRNEEGRENNYHCVAIDHNDNIFLSGISASDTGIATVGAHQTTNGAYDVGNGNAFLAKFDPSGNLVWGTYYSGLTGGESAAYSVNVDPKGNAIIVGWTYCSENMTTSGSFQKDLSGLSATSNVQFADGFIAKFGGDGSLKWGTYYGGTAHDEIDAVCTDLNSNIYVTGLTVDDPHYDPNGFASSGLATPGSFIPTIPNPYQSQFIVKFDSSGSRSWATYFGSSDSGKDAVLFDINLYKGSFFVVGETTSLNNIATANAYQINLSDTGESAFLVKFTTEGSRIWGTYYGGNIYEYGTCVTTDQYGNPIFGGVTASTSGISTVGSHQPTFGGKIDGFLVKFCDITPPVLQTTRNPICKGDPDTVTLVNNNYSVINWYDGNKALSWLNNKLKYILPDTLSSGLHKLSVSIMNIAGCDAVSDTLFLVIHAAPTINPKLNDTMCAGSFTLIGDTATGGASPYSYNWFPSGGISTATNGITNAFPNVTTTYTETVTDLNGCQAQAKITVFVRPAPVPIIIPSGLLSFCTGDSVILRLSKKYSSYSWSDGSFSDSLVVRQSANYSVQVSDSNGCFGTSSVQVTVTPLHPAIMPDSVISLCDNNGVVVLRAAKGYISYLWNDGSKSDSIIPQTPGKYFVSVIDQNGCHGTSDTVIVKQNTLAINIDGQNTVCPQSTSGYHAIGGKGVTYKWTLNGGGILHNTTLPDSVYIQWTSIGSWTLTVTITNANGCTADTNITVIVNSILQPTISPSGNLSICEGDSIVLHAGKGYANYRWSNGSNADSIIVKQAGKFSVTVTGTGGCTGTSTVVNIIINPAPIVSISADGATHLCPGSTVHLSASSGFQSYLWSDGSTTQTITVSNAGQYSVKVTNASGCNAISQTITITIDSSYHPPISGAISVCIGEGAVPYSIPSDPGATYQWTATNGSIIGGQGTNGVSIQWNDAVVGTGTLKVIETTSGGCIDTGTITITIDANLHPLITSNGTLTFCLGDTLTLDAGTGYSSYQWSKDGTVIANEIAEFLRVSQSGRYTVSVTNTSGCNGSSLPVIVTVFPLPPQPTITQIADTLFCSPALTYQWFFNGKILPGETNEKIITTTNGIYTVTITNANGCSNTSAPFTFGIKATAIVRIGQLPMVDPGNSIEIPIELIASQGLIPANANHYIGTLRYDGSMLIPTGSRNGTLGTSTGVGSSNDRIINFEGFSAPMTVGTLQWIQSNAVLGFDSCTTLVIDTFYWTDAGVGVSRENGSFCESGLCIADGHIRLLNPDKKVGIKSIYPNPASTQIIIEYDLVESGGSQIALVDLVGRTVKIIGNEEKPGHYSINVTLQDIPSGYYLATLKTPSQFLRQHFIIQK